MNGEQPVHVFMLFKTYSWFYHRLAFDHGDAQRVFSFLMQRNSCIAGSTGKPNIPRRSSNNSGDYCEPKHASSSGNLKMFSRSIPAIFIVELQPKSYDVQSFREKQMRGIMKTE
jgi:hypothetical protein